MENKRTLIEELKLTETGRAFIKEAKNLEERPKGEWIKTSKERVMCNKCTFIHEKWFANFNFCPNCGADMRGSEVEQ